MQSAARSALCALGLLLLGFVAAVPDKYEIQDAYTNKKFDLVDLLKDYEESDREQQKNDQVKSSEVWNGFWMPHRPGEPTLPPKILPTIKKNQTNKIVPDDHDHRIPMGVKSSNCDDGKTNLTTDWDYSSSAITCYGFKFEPDRSLVAEKYCDRIPKNYVAQHKCMYDKIEYDVKVPLFGTHRPIWPVYGEYVYLPKQRWLHSLEHGAIVMLYHPCANNIEVKRLKDLVTNCLHRHIITPYSLLDNERPLALLSWGCILKMSYVHEEVVIDFIRKRALQAPEAYVYQNGSFKDQLIKKSPDVPNESIKTLCSKPISL